MGNQNRNLFRITRFILLNFPPVFRFFSKFRTPQKNLLIIKTDAIGDYVLFRNYLDILRKAEKYKGYQITLLGNELWRELSLKYDHEFVEKSLFIRPESLYDAPLQTLKLGWRLFKNNYEVVLQPSSTRLFITDGLAGLTAAKQIIGFAGDNEGIPSRYKTKTDLFYTIRLNLPADKYFEFDRSRFFFENVLNEQIVLNALTIPLNKNDTNGIVIFPGAGALKRGWQQENFLALIKLIRQHTLQAVYLAGGSAETQIGNYLTGNLPPGAVDNLIGKTSLPQLVQLIGSAALVIANETSAVHIAVATKTKSVCILGGGHFERFAPYPASFENRPLCLYEKMDCYYCNWECIFHTKENEAFPCVGNVSLEMVWQATQQLLHLM